MKVKEIFWILRCKKVKVRDMPDFGMQESESERDILDFEMQESESERYARFWDARK